MAFLNADGHRLEYEWIGPPPEQAPTIVLLHEGLGSVALWQGFPAQVAERTGCGVLVYSRLGYGKSDPIDGPRPVRYMHHEGLVVLPQVLSALNIRDAILLGHSDGGSIALIHAGSGEAPLIRAVITLAAHVFNEELSVKSIAAAKTAYETTDLREKLARYHDDVDGAFRGWNDIWLHPDFLHWNIEEYLPNIACPLLAIQGEDDQYGTVRQVQAIAEGAGGPVETLMLPDCRHLIHRDQPDLTLDAIADFVARIGNESEQRHARTT